MLSKEKYEKQMFLLHLLRTNKKWKNLLNIESQF